MSDFDGIQERQEGKSRMPLGMTILFIGLVVFGLCYLYLYSPQTTGWTSADQYQRRMEALNTAAITHESKEAASGMQESGTAEQGQAIYKAECVMCHGEKLEGGIGPALTGPKFIYGGTMADLVRTISNGTPKGMPAFEKQLGAEKVRAVAHYLYLGHNK
jgi:cytochrome c oxidase cbb3-type subunit III